MFKKALTIMFILTATLSFADKELCEKHLKNSFSIVCLNGDEYFLFDGFRSGGLTKTGKSCECIKTTGMLWREKFIFKSVKDN